MASRWDEMVAVIDAADFEMFGEAATYTQADGTIVSCTVIVKGAHITAEPFGTKLRRESVTVELRATEVAEPKPGEEIRIPAWGQDYRIDGQPMLADAERRIWILDLKKAI